MNAGDARATSLMRSTETNHMETPSALPEAVFQSPSLITPAITQNSMAEHDSVPMVDVRSVVERRFKRMNETHDRIRTEVLALDPTES